MDWINDRLPTEADADRDGDVAVKQRPGSDAFAYFHWSFVKPGMIWRRTSHWYAEQTPEPATPASQPRPPFTPPGATPEPAAAAVATPTSQRRRIVSLSRTVYGAVHTIDAVADDGTAWWKVPGEADWTQLPALPKREADRAAGVVP